MLSVIIPTLNEAVRLPDTLSSLQPETDELIISDGGSSDDTAAVAQSFGAKVVVAERGRGAQLAAGAREAAGDWLFFVHADTRLPGVWRHAVDRFIVADETSDHAGYGIFKLDTNDPQARIWERRVVWRCRCLGLPYGDQGLLLSRRLYDAVGGFRPIPLFEDVDLVRRIGRRRLAALPLEALTSSERFCGRYWRRSTLNVTLLILYFLGVPPRWLAKAY